MPDPDFIKSQSDTLIEILSAQCSDLEQLLALARSETAAAEERDFETIMRVVSERATIGERLESYHRQIADLRKILGACAEPILRSRTALSTTELAASIQAQDARTAPLLLAARNDIKIKGCQLDTSKRGIGAYLSDGRRIPTACDTEW